MFNKPGYQSKLHVYNYATIHMNDNMFLSCDFPQPHYLLCRAAYALRFIANNLSHRKLSVCNARG
jgi:hypothetical protein